MHNRSPRPRYGRALAAGLIGGNIASFVKWGVEVPLPPRPPGRSVPPEDMLRALGLDPDAMLYRFSGRSLNYGSAAVHHGFSVVFAMLYAGLAEARPSFGRFYGTGFGLGITAVFHGAVLPAGGWAPPVWRLSRAELFSETVGHLLWIWTIEIVRRDLRQRSTGRLPAPAGVR